MRTRITVIVGVAVFLIAVSARAQWTLVVIERPLHAHNLAGIVSDSNGAPLPGVRIEVCDRPDTPCNSDPKHVLASTTTDGNGHFSFPKISMWRTRYLHLSLSGMDPMEVRVKWSLFAHSQVTIKMVVAT